MIDARSVPHDAAMSSRVHVLAAALGILGCGGSGASVGAGGSGSDGASAAGGVTGQGSGGRGSIGTGGDTATGGAGTSTGGTAAGSGGSSTGGAGSSTGGASAGASGTGGSGGTATGGARAGGVGGAGGVRAGTGGAGGGTGGSVSGTGGARGGTGGAGGAGVGDPCGDGNPATVPLPTIGAGAFNVITYGAIGDGTKDNTQAIQSALTAAADAGGGTVTVPSGTFLSGPIVIGSATRLELSAGAVLKMLPRASYTGTTAFITAATPSAHDIALTGAGTIEGQGQAWWDAFAADSTVFRPQEVSLGHVTRVQISGLHFQNSPVEHIWVKQDTDVTITGITISTLAVSGKSPPKNTDGIDITADGAFICNNNIACGDDNIALSGTKIYIAHSTFGVGHGCSIGSITKNGTSGLTVDHVTFTGTTSGIRMKSARDRGGLVENLTYSNITMTNVPTPIGMTSYYPTDPTDPTVDTPMATTATTPIWKNITITNMTATGSTNGGVLFGIPESKISNVTFDNVKIQANTGMRIFHSTGISFTNGSSVTPKSGAAVTAFDAMVSGVTTTPF